MKFGQYYFLSKKQKPGFLMFPKKKGYGIARMRANRIRKSRSR